MSKKTNFGKINGREAMVVGIIIVMVALFSILSPTFRTYSTFVSVLDMSYYIALMAIGVTFTLITGGVDLSIGTGLICYSLFGGYLIVHKDVPVVVALIACLVLSILIGALNGLLVAIMDLPPFLATLCTCMITRGLGSLLSGGFGVSWPSSLEPEGWFRKIFRFTVNGKVIPIGIVVVVVLVLLMNYIKRSLQNTMTEAQTQLEILNVLRSMMKQRKCMRSLQPVKQLFMQILCYRRVLWWIKIRMIKRERAFALFLDIN